MSNRRASRIEVTLLGALATTAGLYFTLVGTGVLPVPGGPGKLHAPLWVITCAGLIFFFAGGAVLLQGIGRANASGALAPDAPFFLHVAQHLIAVGIFACFAMIASWIAVFGEARRFSGSMSFLGVGFGVDTGVAVARAAFGIGALIAWIGTIALAVSAARKLFGPGGKSG
jgi:hypothetical protein